MSLLGLHNSDPAAVAALRAKELEKYDEAYFRTEYWKEDIPGKRGNGGRTYDDPEHAARFDLIASTMARSARFDSLLDVGCGPGLLLRALAPGGARLAGIDASPTAIELARRVPLGGSRLADRAELTLASCWSLPFADASFDAVVCLDVLEHLLVFDIEAAIDEMVRVCRQHLILSINSDNPYFYHPTILSPDTWRTIFASRGRLSVDVELERAFAAEVAAKRDEYVFYCYSVAE